MKKFLTLFMAGFMVLLMFVVPGSPVKAEEPDCHCEDVTPIIGAEKNKIVADLISKDEFKHVKLEAIHSGYTYQGVSKIEVLSNYFYGVTIVGVPFVNSEGNVEMFVFIDGHFKGNSPM
ncbi:hypothetical protein [Neobacillus niacini]|uniref:hypothetical protein n=1 Tax=Neobacillus niacini TaxID=86668 RepID=UPI0028653F8B|nr:hypothetical protein [Neobacillus niacini]MDR7001087.1 hypothetical protein [Neobacillus niacini]